MQLFWGVGQVRVVTKWVNFGVWGLGGQRCSEILSPHCSRLDDPSPEALLRCCEFLQDVLFQDFPPELFLQRPALINVRISLLIHAPYEMQNSIAMANNSYCYVA